MFNSLSDIIGISEVVVVFLVGLIGSASGILISRTEQKSLAAKEQLDKAYSPLFSLIEPKLYATLPREHCDKLIQKVRESISNLGPLVDPKLHLLISRYEQSGDRPVSYNDRTPRYLVRWFEICEHIDFTYDNLCLACHLPVRSSEYRKHFRQVWTKKKQVQRQTVLLINALKRLLVLTLYMLLMLFMLEYYR